MANPLLEKIEIAHEQFVEWVDINTPASWSPDDTVDLLAYVGFVHFMMISEKMPGFTISDLDRLIFGSKAQGLQ